MKMDSKSWQKRSYIINIDWSYSRRILKQKMKYQKPQPFNNLTKGERTALQELGERDDIVIIKTNKSGA